MESQEPVEDEIEYAAIFDAGLLDYAPPEDDLVVIAHFPHLNHARTAVLRLDDMNIVAEIIDVARAGAKGQPSANLAVMSEDVTAAIEVLQHLPALKPQIRRDLLR